MDRRGEMTLLDKINDIHLALDNNIYLAALALALTLPDICGAIEYPECKDKKGTRFGKKQYIAWFDNWVEHYYADTEGWTDDGEKAINPIFTGEMCYSLRCSFLHAGNSHIESWDRKEEDDDFYYAYTFGLALGGVDSVSASWSPQFDKMSKMKKTISIRIDVEQLCKNICRAANKYYEVNDSTLFEDHNINAIDHNIYPIKRKS